MEAAIADTETLLKKQEILQVNSQKLLNDAKMLGIGAPVHSNVLKSKPQMFCFTFKS